MTNSRRAAATLVAVGTIATATLVAAAGWSRAQGPPSGEAGNIATTPTVLDSGAEAASWTAIAAPGTKARIVRAADDGQGTTAFGLDFDLGRGRGHVIARRELSIDLPEDYTFVFRVRAEAEPNTVEIKFISGENVWWRRLQDFEFPTDWKDLRVAKSRLAFAWGPAGGGMPRHLDAIEIAVVPGKGGSGRVWFDAIRLEERNPASAALPPVATASSAVEAAAHLVDGDSSTVWTSVDGDREPVVTLDFHEPVEQGGLVVEQAAGSVVRAYDVEASVDGVDWRTLRRFTKSDGGRDDVFTPDAWARFVRLRFFPPSGETVSLAGLRPQPADYSSSPNGFFTAIARSGRAGLYPRYFRGEQSYWTVVGASGDEREALVNEEGSVEVDAGAFTLEPFVLRAGALRTWEDAKSTVSLAGGDLPIPTVLRRDGDLALAVTAFVDGEAGASTLYVRYRLSRSVAETSVTSPGAPKERLRLFVALRPFQVLPPWQALNRTGGVTKIAEMQRDGREAVAAGHRVVALTKPAGFGAAAFEEGDITAFLSRGELPPASKVTDDFGYASGAFAFDVDLVDGRDSDVWVAVPFHGASKVLARGSDDKGVSRLLESRLAADTAAWNESLDRAGIELPDAARDLADSLRSNLAYVLINRDGPAIQPGSRTYERSWIRDGAMTSAALLELGFFDEAKRFLRWYAAYVGEDGWVPCCVDRRGADPVPEHDSFGEFIWGVADVWRFTRDEAFVRELWPKVEAAAGCMTRLRGKRLTPEYDQPSQRAFRGLLPESISHEGYSARPVHAYWDQVFALRGYQDAAMLAAVVGEDAAARRLEAEREAFAKDLAASVRATMKRDGMTLVPASVELGDFDPTSTAVAFLLGVEDVYPRAALDRSFDKYMADLRARRGRRARGEGYTAYELRSATALLLLGRPAEAVELLETMTADQRPAAWNQWPEISWLQTSEGAFLGDLPHTWIGSTFVHAVRRLLVVEREKNRSLLIGAGVPLRWLDGGGEVAGRDLPTWYGPLSLRIRREDRGRPSSDQAASPPAAARVVIEVSGDFEVPEGGLEVAAPFGSDVQHSEVNYEADATTVANDLRPPTTSRGQGPSAVVLVRRLPATVVFEYKARLETTP